VLYRNETATDHAWIAVRAVGRHTNRDGVGAVVTVEPEVGHPVASVEVGSSTGFLGQSQGLVHVGLGDRDGSIARIRVWWPATGRTTVVRDARPDRVLTVRESR
jgi:hypothetical protein